MTNTTPKKPNINDLKFATERAWMIINTREQSKILTDELRGALKRALMAAKDSEERENILSAIHDSCKTFETLEKRHHLTPGAEWIIETFKNEEE